MLNDVERFAGALFEPEHNDLDLVLKYAVRRVNQRRDLLPITALSSNVLTAPLDDSFTMARRGDVMT